MSGVSVVVVSFHTGPVLDACLDAALADERVRELVIVDNGNPGAIAARLRDLEAAEPRVTLVQGHGNVGFSAGCNLGARRATGAHLVFLNPDVVLEPGAIAALTAALESAPAPAIAGGRLVDAHGREQRGSRRDRLTMGAACVSFLGLHALGLRDPMRHADPAPDAPLRVGAVSGALMAMRRADFETLGGFDEGYFLHVEDFDICRRAEEAGGAVMFTPFARGLHQTSSSAASLVVIERHKARGFARYFRKFAGTPLEAALAYPLGWALRIILPLRARFRRRPRAHS